MSKADYLNQLMQNRSYCSCNSLSELIEKKDSAVKLEFICAQFKRNADLKNPESQDRNFLVDYQEEIKRLKEAVKEYYLSLYLNAAHDKLYFALHDLNEERITQILTLDEVKNILKKNKPIISIHCNTCRQQIDIVSSII